MATNLTQRFWELDLLRGVAILMMIVFHLLYDLDYVGAAIFNIRSGFWLYFARATATIFLLLVGISLTLSFSRALRTTPKEEKLYLKYLKRGSKIFSWGLIITVTTWFLLRDNFVVWGILHLIGISIMLAYPLLKFRSWNLMPGIVLIALGLLLKNISANFPWLLWLGLMPVHFHTLDYFPILPWFGVVLIGVFLGNSLYANYRRSFKIPDLSQFRTVRFLAFLGRHSLLIYLVHQPVLVALLYLLNIANLELLAVL